MAHKDPATAGDDKVYFFDKPGNVTWVLRIFYALCVVLVGLDFVIHRHVYVSFEEWPVFYAVYGFVACVVLVILAKGMRVLLMRDETYYGDEPSQPDNTESDKGAH